MRHAFFRLSLIAALFYGLIATVSAQDYEIKLVRTVKVGDKYGVISNATQEQHMTMSVNGQGTPPRDEAMSASLTAKAEVVTATPGGREGKTRFSITKLTKTIGAQTTEVLPTGTVVIAERVGAKTEFTVGAAPAAPEVAKVLALVISLESDAGANDDVIFGTKERKKVADTWPINAAAAAADVSEKGGLKVDAANISGTATLAEVLKDGLKISATIEMKQVGIPLPPGMAVSASTFIASFSGVFPVDPTKRAAHSSSTMDGKVDCAGKAGDKELVMSLVMKQAKDVTFTAP